MGGREAAGRLAPRLVLDNVALKKDVAGGALAHAHALEGEQHAGAAARGTLDGRALAADRRRRRRRLAAAEARRRRLAAGRRAAAAAAGCRRRRNRSCGLIGCRRKCRRGLRLLRLLARLLDRLGRRRFGRLLGRARLAPLLDRRLLSHLRDLVVGECRNGVW